MYQPIEINEESKFFVAICEGARSLHSFVIVGVEIEGNPVVLGAFGKKVGNNCSFSKLAQSHTTGRIINERVFFNLKEEALTTKINYKAYSINYQQYLDFLLYLQKLSKEQRNNVALGRVSLMAYCPKRSNNTGIKLVWRSLDKLHIQDEEIKITSEDLNQHSVLGKKNTCRNSAVHLTQRAKQNNEFGFGVSSLFFRRLPFKATIVAGIVQDNYFYILPSPPSSFVGMDDKKLEIISQLYERLDKLMQTEKNSPITYDKFQRIKELYETITKDEQMSMSEIFSEIDNWLDNNNDLISTHRKHHWFSSSTATAKMFNKISKDKANYCEEGTSSECSI